MLGAESSQPICSAAIFQGPPLGWPGTPLLGLRRVCDGRSCFAKSCCADVTRLCDTVLTDL